MFDYEQKIVELCEGRKNIFIYWSVNGELNTRKVISKLLNQKKHVILPRIEGTTLKAHRIDKLEDLEKGPFGIAQPKKFCEETSREDIEIFFVPGKRFDEGGNRQGRGKGYFDRFLAGQEKSNIVGMCKDELLKERIPSYPHDIPVGHVLTDKRFITCRPGRGSMPVIMDGKSTAEKLMPDFKRRAKKTRLKLAIILVGSDSSSEIYVRMKQKKCGEVGIDSELIRFGEDSEEKQIISKIRELNGDVRTTAILVQLPLPGRFNSRKILDSIDDAKDVDCLSSNSLGKLFTGNYVAAPATPLGMLRLLEEYDVDIRGKNVLIIGTSNLVGKPLGFMCLSKGATVTYCNSNTRNLPEHTRIADIIMTATGVPKLISEDMVKQGAIIIDIGISKVDGKIVGDVDFENVKDKCSFITPVPGGAGPMTIAMLINNILLLGERK